MAIRTGLRSFLFGKEGTHEFIMEEFLGAMTWKTFDEWWNKEQEDDSMVLEPYEKEFNSWVNVGFTEQEGDVFNEMVEKLYNGSLIKKLPMAEYFVESNLDDASDEELIQAVHDYINNNPTTVMEDEEKLLKLCKKYREFFYAAFEADETYKPSEHDGIVICNECGNILVQYTMKCPCCGFMRFGEDDDNEGEIDIKLSEENFKQDELYCTNCGASITVDSKFCNQCGAVVESQESIFCAYCGEKLDADATFCKNCGRRL